MSKKTLDLTRRAFLTRTSLALAAPAIIPASALGRDGHVAPSEKIILGGIGLGSRGTADLRAMLQESDVQFVAICDPNRSRREAIKKLVDDRYGNTDCALYRDIREFLALRTDIDAMLIATGDRWHALASILAMRAGKDVFSEKPSAMTIAEGRAVVETARRYARIYQSGVQRLSEANFTFANELVRRGRLGDVKTVRAHIAPWDAAELSHEWLPEQPEPPKEDMDWDLWLGPCPWRPFNAAYTAGRWRGYYDFHTSCIGEWGAHTFAQCQDAVGVGTTAGIEYGYVPNDSGDGMVVRFANGVRMILEREGWRGTCGVKYEGTEGWVSVADGYERPDVSAPALLGDFKKIVAEYQERTQRPMNHGRDFFNCIKSRRPTVTSPEVMHYSMSTVHAANISMWLKRDVRYDPTKEEFVNDAEANRLRSRAMREPWII
ncbi:MAG: gfo/Idh/MocA family oxidoreductase [Acidobacteria bacterium]|nr:MAG: gfo/Idh/MocA family oxidoreductase [Acidobacteriota bacterium]